jgi:probable F420-dependent oxidoreductase
MAYDTPFRFGLLVEHFSSRAALIDTAQRAEAAGFSTLLVRDHFVAEPFGHQFSPFVTLAVVAENTRSLRVGTLVIDNDYRHPAVLAKEAATLDLLSDGRFELGLGAGWARDEYEQTGIAFDPAGVRIDRLAESLHVVKALFSARPASFAGRHYQVRGLDSFPKPAQTPHPPILVGAGGRRMLELAAREADIVAIMAAPITTGAIADDPNTRLAASFAERVGWVRDAAGDRFPRVELSMVVSLLPSDDRSTAAESLARDRGWDAFSKQDVLDMPQFTIGTPDQMADDLRALRERLGFSYIVVTDRYLEDAAPLVRRLTGT